MTYGDIRGFPPRPGGAELAQASDEAARSVERNIFPALRRCHFEIMYTPRPMGTLARRLDRAVLVVDDDLDVRATLREMVEEAGLRVFEAPNGQAALDILGSTSEADIHVILLDLRMPIMSGWDFLDRVRRDVRISRIPVVIVSATASTSETAEHPSVVACVQVPYVMSRLREIVTSLAPAASTRRPMTH